MTMLHNAIVRRPKIRGPFRNSIWSFFPGGRPLDPDGLPRRCTLGPRVSSGAPRHSDKSVTATTGPLYIGCITIANSSKLIFQYFKWIRMSECGKFLEMSRISP